MQIRGVQEMVYSGYQDAALLHPEAQELCRPVAVEKES
jgi:hypothetical protein